MKKLIALLVISLLSLRAVFPGEGMWLPLLLEQLNESEMKTMGMRISAEDIYSINKSSLKDAILQFGGGCTAEIISNEGLILTNHHCGYGQIQRHSSLEHDYLTTGFWAMSRSEELPNPGLSVTLLIRMEDVTRRALEGVHDNMAGSEREARILENIKKIESDAVANTHYKAKVKPFYYGNEYYLFVTEVFTDVRLVGAPPSSIGKFGGDTDNWMWPRHTGDFSLFRIYADKDNKPADYSPDNVPYRPKNHLPISLKGAEKGDFTFVFGYPGTTQEYLPSFAIELITGETNPVAIRLRSKRLDIFDRYMGESDLVRIQYSAKHAGVANFWKKMMGENRGIKRLDAIAKKQESETGFIRWASENPERNAKYGRIIPEFEKLYAELSGLKLDETYLIEGGLGVEAIRFAYSFKGLVELARDNASPGDIEKAVSQLKLSAAGFFKNYHRPVDESVFSALMQDWFSHQEAARMPQGLVRASIPYGTNYARWAEAVFSKTIFANEERTMALLDGFKPKNAKLIENDPMFILAKDIYQHYLKNIQPGVARLTAGRDSLQRIYMLGLMEYQPQRRFYPDANSTLRIAYGKVDGFYPRDAVYYRHYTTLEGILEKEGLGMEDYVVAPKLKELHAKKDYGRYAAPDGTMRTAFAASNHTTGGNSGSPVLNADGQLIGINFDRNWEGTMSDLMYDPDQCRNISADIRYVLFIVDKFAGAGHLVQEMTLVD